MDWKPVYDQRHLGILMEWSGCWLFSRIAARILGRANALPLRVWARVGLSFLLGLYLSLSLLAWKFSKLETDETSNHRCWAAEKTSIS